MSNKTDSTTPEQVENTKEKKPSFVTKTKIEILKMSDEERKAYFIAKKQALKDEEKAILKSLNKKANAIKEKNRSKINHAKYIVAGEFLKSPDAKSFLTKLSKDVQYDERDAIALNLLMTELKLEVIKFKSDVK